MPIIHPTYYPDARLWRSHNASAPTIGELLAKLGPGYECRDYYPIGVPMPRNRLPQGLSAGDGTVRHSQMRALRQYARREPVQRSEPVEHLGEPPALETHPWPPGAAPEGIFRPGPDRDNAVAIFWSTSTRSQAEIGREVRATTNSIGSILHRLRKRGDPRAAARCKVIA